MTSNFNVRQKCLPMLSAFALLLFSATSGLHAQGCANDIIPPIAVCKNNLTVSIGPDDPNDCYGPAGFVNSPPALKPWEGAGVTWVNAQDFDNGSYDDCNFLRFTIRRVAPYSYGIVILNSTNGQSPCDDIFPDFPSEFERAILEGDSVKIYGYEFYGLPNLVMRVYQVDSVGNLMLNNGSLIYSECQVSVTLEDKIAPTCPANVTVSCADFDQTLASYGPTDNFCLDTNNVLSPADYTLFDTVSNRGTISRSFQALDCSGNSSACSQQIVVSCVVLQGVVFSDTSANCAYEIGEALLEAWTVKAIGQVTGDVFEVQTNADGEYLVSLAGLDTVVNITLVASSNFGQNCQTEYTVNVPTDSSATQDIPVYLEQRCGLLSVGISTSRLRRCFPNRYTVQACNLSSQAIPDAYVEVALDDYFDYTTSSIPGTLVSGNTYSFSLGELVPGDCQTFTLDFVLDCTAPTGATHCAEARIFPYDDCIENSNWSGADVEVDAVCDGDSIRFAISNIGDGAMTEILDFVVVEDVIMRQEGSFQLGMGQTINFSQPANGSTWRLEAEEEPLHPWGGPQAIALEGCGGINNIGLVNLFPLSDPNPFEALDCMENIGSFDPNDKQGIPSGYGNQHFIEANTDIEYMIRFQNTGTDTAFTVVVLDTLTQQLNASSVRVEVASHPMEFAILNGNVLRFTFNNILLPDSNVNQAASNGFVKFRIAQKPDLADGTLLENSAAIYFDFNDAVITNTTFHTIGDHFISVSTDDIENGGLISAYPNPASDAVVFDLKNWTGAGRFELSNNLGQQVAAERFTGKKFRFERKNLASGIYHFQITANSTKTASGKIILK